MSLISMCLMYSFVETIWPYNSSLINVEQMIVSRDD